VVSHSIPGQLLRPVGGTSPDPNHRSQRAHKVTLDDSTTIYVE